MGIFKKLFKNNGELSPEPEVVFGRFTDSYKKSIKYKKWDEALELFEEMKYRECIRQFMSYLRDDDLENLKFWEDGFETKFEFFQGSKKISGLVDNVKIMAEAKIADAKKMNVGFMRRLLEQNFSLKYSRYALDKNENLTIVFSSYLLDSSPYGGTPVI